MGIRWTQEKLAEYLNNFGKPDIDYGINDTPDKGRESKLQKRCEDFCRRNGYPYFHDRSRKKNKAGWPDLTICLPKGRTIFVELKSEKGELRKEQKKTQQMMIFLGHEFYKVQSYKKFVEIIRSKI